MDQKHKTHFILPPKYDPCTYNFLLAIITENAIKYTDQSTKETMRPPKRSKNNV